MAGVKLVFVVDGIAMDAVEEEAQCAMPWVRGIVGEVLHELTSCKGSGEVGVMVVVEGSWEAGEWRADVGLAEGGVGWGAHGAEVWSISGLVRLGGNVGEEKGSSGGIPYWVCKDTGQTDVDGVCV